MMRRAVALVILLCLAVLPARAQDFATLIADRVTASPDGSMVIADGNVEVLFRGQRLIARRIVYNRATDRLDLTGPITIIESTGNIVTGDSAHLARDMREGIVKGARFLLDQQMQIAAVEMNRVEGRYTQLYKAVASSCKVCAGSETPLWQIRARRMVHDQNERQLYFDNAVFEIAGLPVAYFPRLRLPDPTLKRATGFLTPSIKTNSNLGVGFRFPYFITLGDHADLKLTPYVSANTRTLEVRARRELRFGSIEVNGAVSSDNLTSDSLRGYVFAEGRFHLPRGFDLNVDLRLVSDESYLLTYDYDGADRLASGVEITRTRRNEYITAGVVSLRTLRASELPIKSTLATRLGWASYERRIFPRLAGGELRLAFDLEGHERTATGITAAMAAACVVAEAPECTARDVAHAGATANWRRDWILQNGMIAAVEGQVATDFYWIGQDASYASTVGQVTPTAAVELRWPFARVAGNGASDVIEPVVQLAWTDTGGASLPNEDSKLVEFDEGNLLDLSHFPGTDRYERGWRTTVGLSWTRILPNGNEYAMTVGRVLRAGDLGQFTTASGLDGVNSDWLVATRLRHNRLSLTNRSLFDDAFRFSKSETHLAWSGEKFAASGTYVWVVADAAEGRTDDTSEFGLDAAFAFDRHWTVTAEARYDVTTNQTTNAGLGLEYQNECVNIDISLSRRFTSSATVAASTDFGFQVSLNGFGQDGRNAARSCYSPG